MIVAVYVGGTRVKAFPQRQGVTTDKLPAVAASVRRRRGVRTRPPSSQHTVRGLLSHLKEGEDPATPVVRVTAHRRGNRVYLGRPQRESSFRTRRWNETLLGEKGV